MPGPWRNTSVTESHSIWKCQGLNSLQTKRVHMCCQFKWENALVEANQLQMQSAEVVTRLGEACQDVKVVKRLRLKVS